MSTRSTTPSGMSLVQEQRDHYARMADAILASLKAQRLPEMEPADWWRVYAVLETASCRDDDE